MTASSDDLTKLLGWAGRYTGRPVKPADCSQDHRQSRVLRLFCDGRVTAYLKMHRHARKFTQEWAAYTRLLPQLASRMTPCLLATDERRKTLLIEAVNGTVLESATTTPALRQQCYEQAGRFLRGLHGLQHVDLDPLSPAEAFARRSEHWLNRAGGLLPPAVLATVRGELLRKPSPVRGRERRQCHRDFTARNWILRDLASGSSGQEPLPVIDFEHARPDLPLVDVERVFASLADDVDSERLFTAFRRGYEAPLANDGSRLRPTAVDDLTHSAAFRAVRLQSALSSVVWARRHNDATFERRGRREIERLLDTPAAAD